MSDPRLAYMTEKKFIVTVRATEPPPNWGQQTLEKLTRELHLMYGASASVEPYKETT